MLKAVEEFAAECSYIKMFASEMLDYVADEGVQIHGGYGFHQDYAVERAYRDSRINRIFEGTNEINRLLATGMLLKRAQRGQLPLVEAVKKLQAEILAGRRSQRRRDEDGQAGRQCQEDCALRARRGLPEVRSNARKSTGDSRLHHRYRHEHFRHGIGLSAHEETRRLHKGEIAADACSVFLRESMEIRRKRRAERSGSHLGRRQLPYQSRGAETFQQIRASERHCQRAGGLRNGCWRPAVTWSK